MKLPTSHLTNNKLLQVISITGLSGLLFVFTEWLFFVTKTSFLSTVSLHVQLLILLRSFGIVVILNLIFLLPLILALLTVSQIAKNWACTANNWKISLIIPASMFFFTIILMIDNFTYTLFQFSAVGARGLVRYFYILIYIIIFTTIFRWLIRLNIEKLRQIERVLVLLFPTVIFVISVITIILTFNYDAKGEKTEHKVKLNRPNIVVFSSDGMNSRNMSVYGYLKQTTPFIDLLAQEMLIFENAFTNSGPSTGSISSLWSGKLPYKTRVIYRPDIFKGKDRRQHFVGLLRGIGYTNGDISLRYYLDPYDLNLDGGFDFANGRVFERKGKGEILSNLVNVVWSTYPSESYFLKLSSERLRRRLLHVIGLRNFRNIFDEVTVGERQAESDEERMEMVRQFIDHTSEPFFLNVHLMGTHEPLRPGSRIFSQGKNQTSDWMLDFYDDAILDFDQYVSVLVNYLKSKGKLENTILVLTSDHGMKWATEERVPLMIRFPKAEHAGRISENVQRQDIAPTLLDYLGVTVPEWIDGVSLISDRLDPYRKIVSVYTRKPVLSDQGWGVQDYAAPYFSLARVDVINCQYWYSFNVDDGAVRSKIIKGHTNPCDQEETVSIEEIRKYVHEILIENGYPGLPVD